MQVWRAQCSAAVTCTLDTVCHGSLDICACRPTRSELAPLCRAAAFHQSSASPPRAAAAAVPGTAAAESVAVGARRAGPVPGSLPKIRRYYCTTSTLYCSGSGPCSVGDLSSSDSFLGVAVYRRACGKLPLRPKNGIDDVVHLTRREVVSPKGRSQVQGGVGK